jgi:hypothetical protein
VAAHAGRPNLSFVVGDAAAPVVPPQSLHGIFDSSMLHHVTSFNGYDRSRVRAALAVQVEQLVDHGVLIVRDFVDPGPGEVLLDLPADDGDDSEAPATCSTAALFRRFAREFRVLWPAERRGFAYQALDGARPGWQRFRVARTHAAEFVLRKDYRQDWALEVQEEYTYATQAELEALLSALGLRVLASTPLWNPWILRHRWVGRVELRAVDSGALEDFPPTNYLIVGERVRAGEGVRFSTRAREAGGEGPKFLELSYYRDRETGLVLDLVRRPHDTLDVVPWFVAEGQAYVVARMSYPRPILAVDGAPLDGARAPHYVTEPLVVVRQGEPLAQAVEVAMARRAGLQPEQLRGFVRRGTYYPSPGGLAEEVRAFHVEIEPVFVDRPEPGVTDTTTAGRVGAIEACQLLRAAQVGGLPTRASSSTPTRCSRGSACRVARGSARPWSWARARRRPRPPPSMDCSRGRSAAASCRRPPPRRPGSSRCPRWRWRSSTRAGRSWRAPRASTWRRARCRRTRWPARCCAATPARCGWASRTTTCRPRSCSRAARASWWRPPGACRTPCARSGPWWTGSTRGWPRSWA